MKGQLNLSLRKADITSCKPRGEKHGEEKKLGYDIDFSMLVEPAELPWLADYVPSLAKCMFVEEDGEQRLRHGGVHEIRFEKMEFTRELEMLIRHDVDDEQVKKFAVHRLKVKALEAADGGNVRLIAQAQLQPEDEASVFLNRCYTHDNEIAIVWNQARFELEDTEEAAETTAPA